MSNIKESRIIKKAYITINEISLIHVTNVYKRCRRKMRNFIQIWNLKLQPQYCTPHDVPLIFT